MWLSTRLIRCQIIASPLKGFKWNAKKRRFLDLVSICSFIHCFPSSRPRIITGRRLRGSRSRTVKEPRRASGNACPSPQRHRERGRWKNASGKKGGKAEGSRKGGHKTTRTCRKSERTAKRRTTRSRGKRRSTRPGTAAIRTWRGTR